MRKLSLRQAVLQSAHELVPELWEHQLRLSEAAVRKQRSGDSGPDPGAPNHEHFVIPWILFILYCDICVLFTDVLVL